MDIRFSIPYRTDHDERLAVVGFLPQLGGGEPSRGLRMAYEPTTGTWTGSIRMAPDACDPFDYRYAVLEQDESEAFGEGGRGRTFSPRVVPNCQTVELRDFWRPPGDPAVVFETAPFREVIFKRRPDPVLAREGRSETGLPVQVRVAAPCVPSGKRLYLTGEIPILGAWDLRKALPMHPGEFPFWELNLFVDPAAAPFSYKYALGGLQGDNMVWEPGENRLFSSIASGQLPERTAIVITDWPFRYPDGPWRGAGIAIPVFSLRTRNGIGVGEFSDLKPMGDWAKKMGFRLIQILPVNDTSAHGTWYDSYPYSIISVFALHPIYISLTGLVASHTALAAEAALHAERLNACPTIDYESVMAVKMDLLRRLFREDDGRLFATADFQEFFRENARWLQPYAAFCSLRDRHGTSDYHQWGEDGQGTPEAITRLTDPASLHYPEVSFHYYVQYHLHRQLGEAADYARAQGIVLKGDIPIGVAKGSVETWQNPGWFHMDESAGAPPDNFSEGGQNWGFPTYDWEAMAEDDYGWWRDRLSHLSRYFDAVRLDHVIGFFRIWTIPANVRTALLGRFHPALPLTREELEASGIEDIDRLCEPYASDDDVVLLSDRPGDREHFHPRILMEETVSFNALDGKTRDILHRFYRDYFFARQEALWQAEGFRKLSALMSATPMMICGEDLGMVPRCVPGVLSMLGILALRIERMPVAMGDLFGDPASYPYLSVASPGSHDMSSLRGWWEEEDRALIQMYYREVLGRRGIAPKQCEPWICKEIIMNHLEGRSLWIIIPVQDILGASADLRQPDPRAERINDPAIPHHNWNFRLHRTIGDLLDREDFNEEVRQMVLDSGRLG